MEFTSAHIETLKQNCIEHVKLNQPIQNNVMEMAFAAFPTELFNDTEVITSTALPLTSTVTKETSIFTPDLLLNLQQVGCPFDCYGNGTCDNGMHNQHFTIIEGLIIIILKFII